MRAVGHRPKGILVTTVFAHFEVPFDTKCSWKEFRGALYIRNGILNIFIFYVAAISILFGYQHLLVFASSFFCGDGSIPNNLV